jgi:flagellar hook-length control protein FliK
VFSGNELPDMPPCAQDVPKRKSYGFKNVMEKLTQELKPKPYDGEPVDRNRETPSGEQDTALGVFHEDESDQKTKLDELVSMCQNSQALMNGIVGILEGFGLLDYEAEGAVVPKDAMQPAADVCEEILSAQKAAAHIIEQHGQAAQAAVADTAFQEARMLFEDGQVELPEEVQAGIEEWIQKDLSTFENTHKNAKDIPPVVENRSLFPADGAKKADADRMDPAEASVKSTPVQDADVPFWVHTQPAGHQAGTLLTESQYQPAHGVQQEMPHNLTEIVEKMSASVQQGKSEFHIDLKPEHLGRLSIQLVMDSDGIKAYIKASDWSAKGLIQAELPHLQEMLKQKELPVVCVEVSYEAHTFDFNMQQGRQSGQSSHKNGQRLSAVQIESYDAAVQTAAAVELLGENSSVEFRA